MDAIKDECRSSCPDAVKEYNACVERITAKGSGECEPYYFDLIKCIDKCAAPKYWQNIK
jgi:ubiquinol-cytochrome c reductase subunit 6